MASETMWGRALTMKLAAALVLLALSLVRADFVMRCGAASGLVVSGRTRLVLGALYGLTVVMLLGAALFRWTQGRGQETDFLSSSSTSA